MLSDNRPESEHSSPTAGKREEWRVRILADLKLLRGSIPDDLPGSKGRGFIEREVERKLDECRENSLGWMLRQADRAELNQIVSQDSDHHGKDIVLDSRYLVPSEQREAFTTVVKFLERRYSGQGLDFEYAGPKQPSDLLLLE